MPTELTVNFGTRPSPKKTNKHTKPQFFLFFFFSFLLTCLYIEMKIIGKNKNFYLPATAVYQGCQFNLTL